MLSRSGSLGLFLTLLGIALLFGGGGFEQLAGHDSTRELALTGLRVELGLLCLAFAGATLGLPGLDDQEPELGTFQFDKVEFTDAIPLEYGRFVGATPNPANPHWVVLWFVKPDETIVALRVNVSRGQFTQDALTISRK